MGLFFNRHTPQLSACDIKRDELRKEVSEAGFDLKDKATDVLIKRIAADLYPDGPDKDAAIEAIDKAKYSLLCAIGHYDGLVAEANRWMERQDPADFTSAYRRRFNFSTSHWWIELAAKDFYKTP